MGATALAAASASGKRSQGPKTGVTSGPGPSGLLQFNCAGAHVVGALLTSTSPLTPDRVAVAYTKKKILFYRDAESPGSGGRAPCLGTASPARPASSWVAGLLLVASVGGRCPSGLERGVAVIRVMAAGQGLIRGSHRESEVLCLKG